MKANELTDPLHIEALKVYTKWLNGWATAQGDPDFVSFEDFDVRILHDDGPEYFERTSTMVVDYGDDGGPQYLWVYALMLQGGADLQSLVQGFDTYVSVVMNSGIVQEGWKGEG